MSGWQWVASTFSAAVLFWAARGLPWYKLRGDAEAQRVLLLTICALTALRWFNTDALAGVRLHFLGATVATLMFGPRFALWTLVPASLLAAVAGNAWMGAGADFLATAILPVATTVAVGHAADRWLPPNLLLYVWVRAFLGAALAIAASHLLKAVVAWRSGDAAFAAYLAATPPLMFGEGFFCGGAMTLIVVYRPQWCASFDDARYLFRRPPR